MAKIDDKWIVAGLLVSAALYHPLQLFAANPWEIASPIKPLMFAGVTLAVETLPYLICRRVTQKPLLSALLVAVGTLIAMSWRRAPIPLTLLLIGFSLMLWRASHAVRKLGAYVIIAFIGLGSILNVTIVHASNRTPYPLAITPVTESPETATGRAEDVLLVVMDQYPALDLAREWYGHDPTALRYQLADFGFETLETAWTTNSTTLLAIPSILQLEQVTEEGPLSYGNESSLHRLIGGDNFTSSIMRDAGFTYHHVESGWEAGNCRGVGPCIEGPFLDEITFKLYESSIFGPWLERSRGGLFREGALHTRSALESLRAEFGDGNHDFIFAHFLLPHDPYVVDDTCALVSDQLPADMVANQLSCTDRFIAEAASLADDKTAVLITGDHGTNGHQQRTKDGELWTDEEILERFGIFLTYHLPDGCRQPQSALVTDVMRTVVTCAVEAELPPRDDRFLIGVEDPVEIEYDRMARIMGTDVQPGA